jgi:hypothetical protein
VRTDLAEVSSIMLIKTLTLHSLSYLVGITSCVAVQQAIPSDTAARFQSGTGTIALFSQQIANRSAKSDRLPIMPATPQVNDKVQVPAQIAPNPNFKTDCKPIDTLGRCFADARVNHRVA